jgi:Polyketide cyclase / dehydrase and lipid transport
MWAVRQIQTSIDIVASPTRVWSVLIDFPGYPTWNPFITSIDGKPQPGAQLRVTIAQPGRQPMTFRPVVLTATPWRELRWRGRFVLPSRFRHEMTPLPGIGSQ